MEEFDYATVEKEFTRVMVATGNRLDREWPRRYEIDSARLLILTMFRLAIDCSIGRQARWVEFLSPSL
jgi:hypothetical protein